MSARILQMYWNDIPTSKKYAVSYEALSAIWNMCDRNVRRVLHELSKFDNGDGFVLIRTSKTRGFYKTDDKAAISAYREECLRMGKNLFAPLRKIDKILKADDKQYSFVNNLRVVREDKGLTQIEVVRKMKKADLMFDVPLLSRMENDICYPTPNQLRKLCEIYGCQPEELIATDMRC